MSFFIRVYNNIEYIRSLTLPKRADARKVAYAPKVRLRSLPKIEMGKLY